MRGGRYQRKRAVVADEWAIVRAGLSALLADVHVEVVAETTDGREALAVALRHEADLLVLGAIRGSSPTSVARSARRRAPGLKILVFLAQPDAAELTELTTVGVDALIMRATEESEVAKATRAVLRGERYLSASLVPWLIGTQRVEPLESPLLSSRERDVLGRLALGETNAAIAKELCISLATVKTHLQHIYDKLGARSRGDALRQAIALGALG